MDTMAMIRSRLHEASRPSGATASAIRSVLLAHGGLTHAEVEACGQRLTDQLQTAMSEVAATNTPFGDVRRSIEPRTDKIQCDFGLTGAGFDGEEAARLYYACSHTRWAFRMGTS